MTDDEIDRLARRIVFHLSVAWPALMRKVEQARPGEAFLPRHDGQHDKSCLVCHPVL
jgi:hypothetical protein